MESNIQFDLSENRKHVVLLLSGDNEVSSEDFTNMIHLLTAIGLSPGGSSTHSHTNNT